MVSSNRRQARVVLRRVDVESSFQEGDGNGLVRMSLDHPPGAFVALQRRQRGKQRAAEERRHAAGALVAGRRDGAA
jgi:hypothetical protein